jgi:hypothetical protein
MVLSSRSAASATLALKARQFTQSLLYLTCSDLWVHFLMDDATIHALNDQEAKQR